LLDELTSDDRRLETGDEMIRWTWSVAPSPRTRSRRKGCGLELAFCCSVLTRIHRVFYYWAYFLRPCKFGGLYGRTGCTPSCTVLLDGHALITHTYQIVEVFDPYITIQADASIQYHAVWTMKQK
jgi:hypothetical protein